MTKENKNWTSLKIFVPKLNLNHNIIFTTTECNVLTNSWVTASREFFVASWFLNLLRTSSSSFCCWDIWSRILDISTVLSVSSSCSLSFSSDGVIGKRSIVPGRCDESNFCARPEIDLKIYLMYVKLYKTQFTTSFLYLVYKIIVWDDRQFCQLWEPSCLTLIWPILTNSHCC